MTTRHRFHSSLTTKTLADLSQFTYQGISVIVGILSAIYFLRTVYPTWTVSCFNLHTAIVSGTALSPYRYRILSAGLAELISRLLLLPGDPMVANAIAYFLLHLIVLPVMLVLLFQWLRKWTTQDRALIGVFVVAVLLPLMFRDYELSLYTPIEVSLFIAGLLLLSRSINMKARVLYGLLVAVATLNRETGFILVIAWLVITWDWRTTIVYGGIWLVVFAGLRLLLGGAAQIGTPADWWFMNTGEGFTKSIFNNSFLVPIWIGALVGLRRAPAQLRWLMTIALIYMPLVAVFGLWHEIRLQLVLFPILLPIGLSGKLSKS